MTNGELFIAENPNIEFKLNGSCVWIYFDGVNHYTMPTLWWEQEINLFEKIRVEIMQLRNDFMKQGGIYEHSAYGLDYALVIIDKYRNEVNHEADN